MFEGRKLFGLWSQVIVQIEAFEEAFAHIVGQVGLFDERLKVAQDYDLWFRMARRYPFVHVPEVLLRSRMHAGQGTRRMASECLAEGNANFTQWLDEIALVAAAVANGLDSAIIDPTDKLLYAMLKAVTLIVGKDDFCMNYVMNMK